MIYAIPLTPHQSCEMKNIFAMVILNIWKELVTYPSYTLLKDFWHGVALQRGLRKHTVARTLTLSLI